VEFAKIVFRQSIFRRNTKWFGRNGMLILPPTVLFTLEESTEEEELLLFVNVRKHEAEWILPHVSWLSW